MGTWRHLAVIMLFGALSHPLIAPLFPLLPPLPSRLSLAMAASPSPSLFSPAGSGVNVVGPGTCAPGESVTQVNGQTFCNGVPASSRARTAPAAAADGSTTVSAGGARSVVVVDGRVFIDGVEIPPEPSRVRVRPP